MKKILTVVFLGVVIYLIIFIGPIAVWKQQVVQKARVVPTVETIAEPSVLDIPVLQIQAKIEKVGKDPDGRMGVPSVETNVGWYDLGYKPGELGKAVIDGHLDSPTGPAVFYRLRELKKGDEIIVTDSIGKQLTFVVTHSKSYSDAGFPILDVFGPDDKRILNLITCEGVFDTTAKNYSDRFVVFSELQNPD